MPKINQQTESASSATASIQTDNVPVCKKENKKQIWFLSCLGSLGKKRKMFSAKFVKQVVRSDPTVRSALKRFRRLVEKKGNDIQHRQSLIDNTRQSPERTIETNENQDECATEKLDATEPTESEIVSAPSGENEVELEMIESEEEEEENEKEMEEGEISDESSSSEGYYVKQTQISQKVADKTCARSRAGVSSNSLRCERQQFDKEKNDAREKRTRPRGHERRYKPYR